MITIGKREKLDRRFKRFGRITRWIRIHINKKLGRFLTDKLMDIWDASYKK